MRILAIDPFSRGVGFVVLEGHDRLIDWGLKATIRPHNAKASAVIGRLLNRFKPDILTLEDWEASGSRRCQRVQQLLDKIARDGSVRMCVRLVRPSQLRAIGPAAQTNTKYGRASLLAERFPELKAFLPRLRKPWMSEDARMAIFDALAFACAAMQPPHQI